MWSQDTTVPAPSPGSHVLRSAHTHADRPSVAVGAHYYFLCLCSDRCLDSWAFDADSPVFRPGLPALPAHAHTRARAHVHTLTFSDKKSSD